MLNDRVIPFFDSKEIPVLRVFCQIADRNIAATGNIMNMSSILDQEKMDHTKTKAKSS